METKEVIYKEMTCKTALNPLKRRMPYRWDLNIYRGCEHGCKYCYALYSHAYLGSDRYHDEIFVKTNVVERLERELSHPDWKREVINIGGVTDSYQPVEETYRLMPEILKLLIKYRTPAIISTKSDLILRDFDLIDELSRITYVNVAATVTTMEESKRKQIEPGAVESTRRIDMLKAFRRTNASVGLHAMPIIPYLTDDEQNLERIFESASDCDVHYALTGTLYLRGKTRPVFLQFVREVFPELYEAYLSLYETGGAKKAYKDELYGKVNRLRDFYGVSASYSKPMKEKLR